MRPHPTFAWLAAQLLLAALAACGPSAASRRADLLAEGQERLAEDPSAALQTATRGLVELGEDPRLELLAAQACLRLGRRGEALEHADKGLAGELDDALRGDLSWAKGLALMARFRELQVEDDWRAANTTLEAATGSGSHRAEAAFLLVGLQDMGNHRDDQRQLKFARLLLQLDPDGAHGAETRAMLAAKGLTP